jgi:peptidoglycan/xylan/chitin deacetylase (PgdA/CDA1 family)
MNWNIVGFLFIAFFLLAIIGFILILYIRHWANRNASQLISDTETEGVYFKRYLPPLLVNQYSEKKEEENARKIKKNNRYQFLLSLLTIATLITIVGGVIHTNKYKLVKPIELDAHERSSLVFDEYSWESKEQQVLPDLQKQIRTLQINGITLLKHSLDDEWTVKGKAVTLLAETQWKQFTKRYNIPLQTCDWEKLIDCDTNGSLYLVLPGNWDNRKINHLLSQGKSLLFYGFPKQIFDNETGRYTLEGLEFQRSYIPNLDQNLALIGDKELTLGFDAGLILNVFPSYPFFEAHSKQPQAVSIVDNYLSTGTLHTRLYSSNNDKSGRLIWMDFSPNKSDHSLALHHQYFDALLASIFRYLNKETYSTIASWPAGKSFAALMEEDTEDEFRNAKRVANYFQEKNYPITWFVLSNNAQEHRDITKLMASTGEIACHGDNHQAFTLSDNQQQHIRLARCKKALEHITGKTVQAFRPPEEKHNSSTLSAIANVGMTHFIAKTATDRFVPAIYETLSKEHALVSIPRMNSDDYTLWHNYKTDGVDSISLLYKESDQIEKIGGLFMFSFHTQYMDNNEHFKTVTQLADYIASKPAYFATSSDIADWWLIRAKLLQGDAPDMETIKKYQPVRLNVDYSGKLTSTVINMEDPGNL